MDANVLIREVEGFASIDPEMQLNTMLTFLYIARRGVCIQQDIERELGLSNATASRNVSYWTAQKAYNKPGVGFVERMEDPKDRRQRLLRLTKEGKAFFDRIQEREYGKAAG